MTDHTRDARGAMTVYRKQLEALIDIYDDAHNNAPEHRCYVDGAFAEQMAEARALLKTAPSLPAVDGLTVLALHADIMNLRCVVPDHLEDDAAVKMAYRIGHRDARHAAAELTLAAPRQPGEVGAGVPDGWKLVPLEPTSEMTHAGRYGGDPDAPKIGERAIEGETAWPFCAGHTAELIYRAMLAAAPAASAKQEDSPECQECHGSGRVEVTHEPLRDGYSETIAQCCDSCQGTGKAAAAQSDREWRIQVAGPAGYVRFETFAGETLDDALESVRTQRFATVPDEDGFVTIQVQVHA